MALKKQEFYEGAALHVIARTGAVRGIEYDPPFFLFNDRLYVLFKYCARTRSPWGFTFTPDEQVTIHERAVKSDTVIALICGSDGVAALSYASFLPIGRPRQTAIHISCCRRHGEYYGLSGPDGTLSKKVSPSTWQNIFEQVGSEHETL